MRYPAILFVIALFPLTNSNAQYVFEGRVKERSLFNKDGVMPNYVKDFWYVDSVQEYFMNEQAQFDSCNIAYFLDSLSLIINLESRSLLEKAGIPVGLYHGVYFTKHKEGRKEVQVDKDMYIAFLGLDMERFRIKINFISFNRQYVMNYDLDYQKRKISFLRMFTYKFNDQEYISISCQMQDDKLVISTHYNKQDLVLTITPRESKWNSTKRKVGLNKKSLTIFLPPRETKDIQDLLNEQDSAKSNN